MRIEELVSMEIDMENHLQMLMQKGQQIQGELAKVKAEKVRRNNIFIEKKRSKSDVQTIQEKEAEARNNRGK